VDMAQRCAHKFFNTLSKREFERAALESIENMSYCQRVIDEFFAVRGKYGKKSAYSDEMSGLKIIRQTEIRQIWLEEEKKESIGCAAIPVEKKTRIENMYEEGNLFYMRAEGPVYPGAGGSTRNSKLFMFADLRNSTETTMKLTKDTAGFLTPYLNTVYSVSKEHAGTEIYFAGDGYAAHFGTATECIRAAYCVHGEFAKLRREAEDGIRRKEKEICAGLLREKVLTQDMKLSEAASAGRALSGELAGFFRILNKNPEIAPENAIRLLAEEYSMPKVEIGIGITLGELFFAVIGEEKVRFNIVLSPSLTQAARLSGSNAEVKQYLEKLYGVRNIPRKACVNSKKLFNQGIVITGDVFEMIRKEVDIKLCEPEKTGLSYGVYYYYDSVLNRNISISKLEQGVSLKGIEGDVEVFEVFTPAAAADSFINEKLKKA